MQPLETIATPPLNLYKHLLERYFRHHKSVAREFQAGAYPSRPDIYGTP